MTTTKDKLEFTFLMGRHTRATLRQCQALMRYAATLQRLAEDDCNISVDDAGLNLRNAKRERIQHKVTDLCDEIRTNEHQLKVVSGHDTMAECVCGSWHYSTQGLIEKSQAYIEFALHTRQHSPKPVFSGDPRGAVLKIRVPSGFSNSFGDEGIVVPS